MGKTIQYELWQECNNFCTYCTLGDYIIHTPESMKLEAICTAMDEISQVKPGEVSSIGLIGGEFFQGQLNTPEVKTAFMELIKLLNKLLNTNVIEEVWLNATLTLGKQTDLYESLNLIDHKDRVWILTSYDSKGRFNDTKLKTWMHHMKKLRTEYPDVKLNTTTIITGDFIEQYLKGQFNIGLMKSTYNTSVFLKTPVKPDDKCDLSTAELNKLFGYEFFPTKSQFIKFLMAYKQREGDEAYEVLFSNTLKAGELHKNFNDDSLRNVTFVRTEDFSEHLECDKNLKDIKLLPCGHPDIYNCYADQDGCVICDKRLIQSL